MWEAFINFLASPISQTFGSQSDHHDPGMNWAIIIAILGGLGFFGNNKKGK